MSIIRKGKRVTSVKKVIGLVMGIIVLLGLIIGVSFFLYNKKIILQEKEEKDTAQGIVLTVDLPEGSVISENQVKSVTLSTDNRIQNLVSVNDAIGKRVVCKVSAGTLLSCDLLEVNETYADDIRKHAYTFIEMTDRLQSGDYVDIRIQFGNGLDYIILAKKRVLDCSLYDETLHTNNCIWLEVSEEEILLLSSAVVDAYYNDNARIYAIQYVARSQPEAVVTYPENTIVHELIMEDPNVVQTASSRLANKLRERVTKQLKEYTQSSMEESNAQAQISILPKDEADKEVPSENIGYVD